MRYRIAVLGTITAVLVVIVGGVSATADYFGKWYADSRNQDFWYSSAAIGTARASAMDYARITSLAGGTVMTTSKVTQYATSTDVAVIVDTPPPDHTNWLAWTSCTRPVSGSSTTCNQHTITFNVNSVKSSYNAIACHETGHTVGLKDGQAVTYGDNSTSPEVHRSCMRSNPDVAHYSNHDKVHINAKY